MILSKYQSATVTNAKKSLVKMCTSDDILNGYVSDRYKFDQLIQSDMDKMSECCTVYEYNESILKLPIYKSSSFYYDLKHITDSVSSDLSEECESGQQKTPNSFYNDKILPDFLMQFGGIIPLWTSVIIPKGLQKLSLGTQSEDLTADETDEVDVEIKRNSNQNAESHMNIVKALIARKIARNWIRQG